MVAQKFKKNWSEEIKINKISVEAHSKCNARCSYCSDVFYGGLNPNYNLEDMLKKFKDKKIFEKDVVATGVEENQFCLKILIICLKSL